MKARLLALAARVDAMAVRERALLFAAAVAVLVFLMNALVLDPINREHKSLRNRIAEQENQANGIATVIVDKVEAYKVDPDAATRTRLAAVKAETERLNEELRAMQHGLVAPERMVPLLEALLRANPGLRVVSMRTLDVQPVGGAVNAQAGAASGAAPAAPEKPVDLLYRHGVELTLRGSYLDLVDYMTSLEAMPAQLFWGKAELQVEEYPVVRLSLTLHTLSLDKKWMKL